MNWYPERRAINSAVRDAASVLSEYWNTKQKGDPLKSKVGGLFDDFTNASRSFIEMAEAESGD